MCKCALSTTLTIYTFASVIAIIILCYFHYFGKSKHQETSPFPKSSITQVSNGLPTSGYIPISFIDLSRSGNIDIVYKKDDSSELAIYRYAPKKRGYNCDHRIKIDGIQIKCVIPIDFQNRGYNDLLLVHSTTLQPPYNLSILVNEFGYFSSSLIHLSKKSNDIPFVFDYFQNGNSQIIFEDSETNKRIVYDKGVTLDFYSSIYTANIYNSEHPQIITKTDSTSKHSEIGIHIYDENKWIKNQTISIPPNSGKISVGDFDGDGYLDIVFPVFPEGISSFLCVMFNGPDGFTSDIKCENKANSMMVRIPNIKNDSYIHIGDMTLTGTPDLAIDLDNDIMEIVLNQKCVNCGPHEIVFISHSKIKGNGGMIDLYNDGNLDIVTNNGAYYSTLASSKSFFLKVTPLTNHCLDGCKSGDRNPDPAPISTVYNGALMKLTGASKQGEKFKLTASLQVHEGLSMPYYIFGLEDKTHYVQDVQINTYFSDTWTWILPNSSIYPASNHQIRVYNYNVVEQFETMLGWTGILMILGFFLILFTQQEEKEDKKEAEEMLPLF